MIATGMSQLEAAAMAYATNQMDFRAYQAAATADDVSKLAHFVGRFASDLTLCSIDCLRCSCPTTN